MFNPEEYIQKIHSIEHGDPRLDVMKQAIGEADNAGNAYWGLYFRHEYIKESCFHGDNFKAIIMFPEYLKLFDEHPELEEEMYADVMWAFKWMLDDMQDYYQIRKEDLENYFEEYKKRCIKYGYSMRVYYMKWSRFLLTCNKSAAKEAYTAFRGCKRDGNCDCEACETNHDMRMALEFGQEEEAMQIAQPILNGEKHCAEIPHVSYGYLTHYYLYKGKLEEAAYYGRLCESKIGSEPEFLLESGYLLELYSVIRPSTGWRIFKNNIQNFVSCKNPLMRLGFARGAGRLVRQIAKQTDFYNNTQLSFLNLPKSEEGFRTADIAQYFWQIAINQSRKLDERNGSTYYMDILETKLPECETEDGLEHSIPYASHGFAERSSYAVAAFPDGELPDIEQMRHNIEDAAEQDGVEILRNTVRTEPVPVLQITFRCEGQVYDAAFVMAKDGPDVLEGSRPSRFTDPEILRQMQETPDKMWIQMELCENACRSFHVMMKLLVKAVPNLLGIVNLVTGKVYPGSWAVFKGTYEESVFVQDLIDLHITGTQEGEEVWMTTIGLSSLGLRELEIIGADKQNFIRFADLLFFAGCQCAEKGFLPDAGENFTAFRIGEQIYRLTWELPEKVLADSAFEFAAKAERESASGILFLEGGELPTGNAKLREGEDLVYPNSNQNFVQNIQLAKASYPIFEKALHTSFEMAAVRLEFPIPEELVDEAGYAREILWAEIEQVKPDGIYAVLKETSEYLPDLHEDDRIPVSRDAVTAWLFQPEGEQYRISQSEGFLLMT